MSDQPQLTAEEHDRIRRMRWWHEAKFGLFIHWGLYSVIGRHEWAMEVEGIPVAEYEQLATRFTPKPHAARDWARLARRAGMKYMVMTTKHHEGFCLFDTQYTDYCAPKRACGRDLVAEYVEAARAEGLRVGFYYSLMDWHHPDGARCAQDEAARKRFVEYIHGQVRELCTNYGTLDILWYDVAWPLDADGWESAKMNRMVRELQPDIILNNRSRLPEDFSTPEQHIHAEAAGRAWEACMTMNESWGYHQSDDAWKTPKQIIRNLVTCARDGGNYLLNIGPKPDGSIPEPSIQILNAVGAWIDRNGETIYGAERCGVTSSLFANFTRKGNTLYVHAHFWPGESWSIAGLKTEVKSARLLRTGQSVAFEQTPFHVRLTGLPADAPDDPATVLALECASVPEQDMLAVRTGMPRGTV
ncbi:MAG: alpha-L-fucosidase [Candidatus Latescibacteria bacterium]|nr:alpha-L-fucosidase [Candidatus Latescibacterota bacterium]